MAKRHKAKIDDPTDYTLMLPMAVLAMTLGTHGWRSAHRLMQVCKRFLACAQTTEFWMPVVRAKLLKECPSTHVSLLDYVNPFFRFPAYISMCPPWPWWHFLHWIVRASESRIRYATVDGAVRISIVCMGMYFLCFEEAVIPYPRSTGWFMEGNATFGQKLPFCCTRYEYTPHQRGPQLLSGSYSCIVNDQFVWYEGTVASGKPWRGAVREDRYGQAEHDYRLVAIPGQGKYI